MERVDQNNFLLQMYESNYLQQVPSLVRKNSTRHSYKHVHVSAEMYYE